MLHSADSEIGTVYVHMFVHVAHSCPVFLERPAGLSLML